MLIGVLGGAFAWLAYAEVQRALRTSGTERLSAAAQQVASLLEQSVKARLAETSRAAQDPKVRALLGGSPDAEPDTSQVQALGSRSSTTSLLLFRQDGGLLRQVGASPLDADSQVPPVGVSRFVAEGGRVWYYTAVPIELGDDEQPKILAVRRSSGSSQASVLIERLIGSGAVLKFGNASHDLWTDLNVPIEAPPVQSTAGSTTFTSESGEPWIGVSVPVNETPWVVWVAVAERTMLSAGQSLIRQMVPITVALMVFGAFAVYTVSGRITTPLESVAQAAEAITAGDYSRRVAVDRGDEIGRLGAAFNVMAARVQADHDLLEQRVAARTQELEAFSYSVSHDLRAPLRHIAGFAALLEKHASDRLDDQSRRYVDTISGAARQMGRLVDDLLAFSRMARVDMMRSDVDLGMLVREIVEEVKLESPGRQIVWTIGDLPVVRGDRAMLKLAFANLIQNAHKYTSRRDVAEIAIGTMPPTAAGHVIFVRDNGAGFDMNYAAKLFGVFQRLHGADEFEGTGIGLANVHRIVERHGGRTWAEGQVDAGATFYVALPAEEGRADDH